MPVTVCLIQLNTLMLSERMMSKEKSILIVEDEKHLAVGIKYNLEAEGYDVTTVVDGPAALKYINKLGNSLNLVILDIMLPGMSGYTICETIRDTGNEVPVLMLSARTLPEDRARGFDVGANQYLTKPFELEELLSRVKNLLKHQQRNANRLHASKSTVQEIQFGHAHINFQTQEAVINEKKVRLTHQEFKLMRYFVENEGRIIPRAELLESIWGLPGHISTRAPDQFIRRLRKIFEENPSNPKHFITVRDSGYRFTQQLESPT